MKSLRDKIKDKTQPVIFYELLPPSCDKASNVEAYIDCVIDLLTSTSKVIDAINIPEIRNIDHQDKKLTSLYHTKMDAAFFARLLEQASYKNIEMVLNHCTVYEPWPEQKEWLETAIQKSKLSNFILVGGDSSKIHYAGPSVLEMARYIRAHYREQIFCGGITIQTRRYHEQVRDEPFRLVSKSREGLEFFTSQVIYEPVSIKFLLRDYAAICKEHDIAPQRIFLSFAPISTVKDLEFLRWLGVSIPKGTEQELLKADIGIGWRSAKIATAILQDILTFIQKEKIQVPLGLNIEHVTRHNFELSLEFIERLGNLYNLMWSN